MTTTQRTVLSAPSAPAAQRAGSVRAGVDRGVAEARHSFLSDAAPQPGLVRAPILASWTRSRRWNVRPDQLELGLEPEADSDTLLTRAAEPVLRDVADRFATEPVSVVLCDVDGVVLSRRTGDRALEHYLNRVWLAPGFSYAERDVGTNGIGTALEIRGPAQVFGHEHYADKLEVLACAGAPIRHPISGRVVGVLDLTCWQRHAGPLLASTAGVLAQRIEEMIVKRSSEREAAVLSDYLAACRRNRGAVLALGEDLFMMNDRARQLLDPADQEPLLAEAEEALASGRRHSLLIDLPSGRTVRVHCRPTLGRGGGVLGGVLDVQFMSPTLPTDGRAVPAPPTAHQVAVGSGAAWVSCYQTVCRHQQAGEWLVLEGEPGSGRETVVRAAHAAGNPAGLLRVVRADTYGPSWLTELAEEMAAGACTVLITDVDQLTDDVMPGVVEVLERYRESTESDRPWVVATTRPAQLDSRPALAELIACFPRTVDVPPLRRHIEDLDELVPHLLARAKRDATPVCSPEVMRVLKHNRWPGNVDQLQSVLRRIITKRRAGTIELTDLPAECWTAGKRVLSPLESLECDAIVSALLATNGNKVEAARRLSMSRATIYRKVRDYAIVLPSVAELGLGG